MTTMNSILVKSVRSNKSENNVWAVFVQGEEQPKSFCTSPYKAMRYAFFLKKTTGAFISKNSLSLLSMEIQKLKEASMTAEQKAVKEHIDEVVEEFIEEHSVDNVLAKADAEKKKAKSAKKRTASTMSKKEKAV